MSMMQLQLEQPSLYNVPHPSWRPHQWETAQWALGLSSTGICEQPTGCHAPGQQVIMWDGRLKQVEDISVGDILIGPDSTPRHVLSLIQGEGPMFRVSPVKGNPFIVSFQHVLTLIKTNESKKESLQSTFHQPIVDVSIQKYLNWSNWRKHIFKLFRTSVEFSWTKFWGIEPYFMGVLLGDGSMGGVGVTTMDEPIVKEIYKQANEHGLQVRVYSSDYQGQAKTYSFVGRKAGRDNFFTHHLKRLRLRETRCGTKFIPFEYQTASRSDRLQILAGLMDTDGHLSRGSVFDYISKSQQLAEDVAFVSRSVGLAAYVSSCQKHDQNGRGGEYFRVSISGEVSQIPCRLKHKQSGPRQQKKDVLRTGFTVECVGDGPYFGFSLDGDRRYLLGDFTVTHNSGKSAVAKAVSSRKSVIALVKTKFLQEQYGREYSGDLLFGKANYLCSHPDTPGATCGECLFAEEGMYKCPHQCAYLMAKAKAAASPFAILNYAYWMTSRGFREKHMPQVLVLDEAHSVPDEVTAFCGSTITDKHRIDWQLPDFPRITAQGKGMFVNTDNDPVADAIGWLETARTKLGEHYTRLKREAKGDTDAARKARKRLTRCERLGHKLRTTLNALKSSPDDWFIRGGKSALQFGKDKRPGFVAKPLTARHHFKDYFLDGYTTLMMSATIGDARTFAAECGVREYDARVVPHRFAPEDRPVISLGVPGMGRKATNADFEHQADAIARAVKSVNPAWSGLILVSRKKEARLLADRLAHRGLQDRVFVPPGWGREMAATNVQLQAWENRKRRAPNSLCVSWSLWQGFDGRDERICIVAKAPFPFIGSTFERARMKYSGKMFLQRTAWMLEQGLGRTRRGRDEDYGPRTGLVAIADRNWRRVRKYLSQATRDAIVED